MTGKTKISLPNSFSELQIVVYQPTLGARLLFSIIKNNLDETEKSFRNGYFVYSGGYYAGNAVINATLKELYLSSFNYNNGTNSPVDGASQSIVTVNYR